MSMKRKQNTSKKTRWLKKQIKNHKMFHMKEKMNVKLKKKNPWREQPKRKLNKKETSNDQLKANKTHVP